MIDQKFFDGIFGGQVKLVGLAAIKRLVLGIDERVGVLRADADHLL
jgi:hypothetical protein